MKKSKQMKKYEQTQHGVELRMNKRDEKAPVKQILSRFWARKVF